MTDTTSTILVADADEATRGFLAAQLTADGYQVLTARQPAEVRARAARGPVALLVLGDFERLGESVGLLREIRAGDGRHGQLDPALPVVVIGRDAGELAVLRSLETGADDYLGKPFSYPVLRARSPRSCAARSGRARRWSGGSVSW
jgi:DNA-binding response OmpR family regulator